MTSIPYTIKETDELLEYIQGCYSRFGVPEAKYKGSQTWQSDVDKTGRTAESVLIETLMETRGLWHWLKLYWKVGKLGKSGMTGEDPGEEDDEPIAKNEVRVFTRYRTYLNQRLTSGGFDERGRKSVEPKFAKLYENLDQAKQKIGAGRTLWRRRQAAKVFPEIDAVLARADELGVIDNLPFDQWFQAVLGSHTEWRGVSDKLPLDEWFHGAGGGTPNGEEVVKEVTDAGPRTVPVAEPRTVPIAAPRTAKKRGRVSVSPEAEFSVGSASENEYGMDVWGSEEESSEDASESSEDEGEGQYGMDILGNEGPEDEVEARSLSGKQEEEESTYVYAGCIAGGSCREPQHRSVGDGRKVRSDVPCQEV